MVDINEFLSSDKFLLHNECMSQYIVEKNVQIAGNKAKNINFK